MPRWSTLHRPLLLLAVLCVAAAAPTPETPAPDAPAPAFTVSANVDKTQVVVGEQLTLTITLAGDLSHVEMRDVTLPSALPIAAQSRSTNVRRYEGRTERFITFVYLLVPRETGTFQLGPFHAVRHGQDHATEAISVEVIRNPLPPPSPRPVQRLTI